MCGLTLAVLQVSKNCYICSMAARTPSTSQNSGNNYSGNRAGQVSGQSGSAPGSRSGGTATTYRNATGWQKYADGNGNVTSPPTYPDTSFGAYLKQGGNLLGIGYNAWKDKLIAEYNTAYNMYQQWYDSAKQQVNRLVDAGLNTNLGYSMASPGSSPGGAYTQSSGPSPLDVFTGGIGALTGLASGTKALAEAAQIVNELPESKLKGNIARQVDAAARAGAINAENTYMGSLWSARNTLGLAGGKARQEQAEQAYHTSSAEASKSLLDYMTSHDAEGSETDFAGSVYTKGETSRRASQIIEYHSKKAEWDNLLSNPEYYRARLQKLKADGYISYSQAWQARQILEDPNMDNRSKFLALQPGLPGFLSKLSFSLTDALLEGFTGKSTGSPFHGPVYRGDDGKLKFKWFGRGGLFMNY